MNSGCIEVRGLLFLKKIFEQRNWPFPYYFPLDRSCSALELANMLQLPLEQVEAVFINGKAYPIDGGSVKPGDRVTFLSPGTPGPHRFLLGIARMPDTQ